MENKEGKIFRFRDGFNEEYLKSRDDRENNKIAYNDFQRQFVAKSNAMDRRIALVVLGTRQKKKKGTRTSAEKRY